MRPGTSQRAVVPMIPARTEPSTSLCTAATSATNASISAWMRRARSTTARPSSVRAPRARSTSVTPSSRSKRATWVETFDWTVWRATAAAENVLWSATATSVASWRMSIARNDDIHREKLLARWREARTLLPTPTAGRRGWPSNHSATVVRRNPPSVPTRWKGPVPPTGPFCIFGLRTSRVGNVREVVATSKPGARQVAFFDLDRTLLQGGSGPVISEALRSVGIGRSIPGEGAFYRVFELLGENRPTMVLTRQVARFAAGWPVKDVRRAGELAGAALAATVQPFARPLFEEHRRAGRLLVLATTTPYELVRPLADALGFDDVVATRYGEKNGAFDGTIVGEFVWGSGKLNAVRAWAEDNDV